MATRKRPRKRPRLASPVTVPGAPPGVLAVDPRAARPVIRVIAYGPEEFVEQQVDDASCLEGWLGKWPVTWVNVDGLGDTETLTQIRDLFGLHRLALEDVTSLQQRPKVEEYGDVLFIVARMLSLGEFLDNEQCSLFLGKGFVLTFQEKSGDCFDAVRERIRTRRGRVRSVGADYLAYALLDALIDAYFPVVEVLGERLDGLEDHILASTGVDTASDLHSLKRILRQVRRATWPLREAFSSMLREPSPLMSDDTRVYLRDSYDHCMHALDLVEMYRELSSDLMSLHMTTVSNRMNDTMRVLTVIATIFIPLSFVAGVYGMNFERMPELKWAWGYPACLAIMVGAACAMLLCFWRKGWLGSPGENGSEEESTTHDRPN